MVDLSSIGDLVAGFAPEGPLRTVVLVVYGLCAATAPFIYKYYLGVLAQGAKPEGSIERQDYERLRASLKEGNLAARLYAKWLTKFLDWIERFFGDAGMADRTLFLHAFGLKKPAPLWTAPALDRCLLLALVYPIATIFLIWTISGHVGPAERAFGLTANLHVWQRLLVAATIGFSSNVYRHFILSIGRKSEDQVSIFLINAALKIGFTVAFSYTDTVAFAIAATVTFTLAATLLVAGFPIRGPGAFAFASALVLAITLPYIRTGSIFFAAIRIGALLFVSRLVNDNAIEHRQQGVLLTLVLSLAILVCLGAANSLSFLESWKYCGPILLFLGLLTLLNAPFDWASLGLTRALLRRGLELGGWWPTFLAIVDACLAGVIIALLALTMVIGVQAFDELAVHGGGAKAAVLPLGPLFDGIAKNPGAPEYWWACALLLSTMIPSLINLTIGGMALTRGIPGVSLLLLRWIPEGRDVPDYRRPLAALVLTGQMFSGAALGIAAQALIAWGLLYQLMPAIGLDLLWLCRQLACLDLPGKFFHLTGIIP